MHFKACPTLTMRYTLYFAYGSNMNHQQFTERCPSSHIICRAQLLNYQFVITSRGYANVLKKESGVVHGLLCAITEPDEKTLDLKEGVYLNKYRREWHPVETEFGYTIPALIYIDNTEDKGSPKPGYLKKILAGAEKHQLPPDAIREIELWSDK